MTETTTTDGEKLRSPGPETTREESALRRFGSAVTRLVTKGLRADRGTNRGTETMQPSSSDRAGVDYPDASEEKLDEKTLQTIEKIENNWTFRIDTSGSGNNFVPNSYPDFASAIASGNYESIEELMPNIRELTANDNRLDLESGDYDEFLSLLVQDIVTMLFRKHYKHMPKLTASARHAMQEQIDSMHSLNDGDVDYDKREEDVARLLSAELALPEEVASEFECAISGRVAEMLEDVSSSRGWKGLDLYVGWLADHGFPPERWPQDAREREDFPEPLRRMIDEREGEKAVELDRAIIRYCIERTEVYDDNGEMRPNVYKRSWLIQEYFAGRLPKLNREMMLVGTSDVIVASSSKSTYEQINVCNDYIQTVREIGQDNANKLNERLGIIHFSDWNPRVLEGTLHILETGCTESGNPATAIIRGDSGDYNDFFRSIRSITSGDILAVEVNHTDALSGITEDLKNAGVNDDTFDTVILFGHGDENAFHMSCTEHIKPDPNEWYNKGGVRKLMQTLDPDTIILISCHPFKRREDVEQLAISEDLQRRQGTATALSIAFSGKRVFSGLDGLVRCCTYEDGAVSFETEDDKGRRSPTAALTRYGLTKAYNEETDGW